MEKMHSSTVDKDHGFEPLGSILKRIIPDLRGGVEKDLGDLAGAITDEQQESSVLIDKLVAIEDLDDVEEQDDVEVEQARDHRRHQPVDQLLQAAGARL